MHHLSAPLEYRPRSSLAVGQKAAFAVNELKSGGFEENRRSVGYWEMPIGYMLSFERWVLDSAMRLAHGKEQRYINRSLRRIVSSSLLFIFYVECYFAPTHTVDIL